ncbi:MAG: hypothetical protein RL133_1463 [Pseudomonadota bacterium]
MSHGDHPPQARGERRSVRLAGASLLGLALLFPGWGQSQTPGPLEFKPCRVDGLGREAKCAWLARPLNPDAANQKDAEIRIRVVVIPARARIPKPDPVFFLAGGPGQSAIELAPLLQGRFGRLLNRRDLVLVDQRGTGQSAPLHCPMVSPTRPLSLAVDPQEIQKEIEQCLKAAQSLPYGDLTAFTTTHAMHDLDAVRAALGAEQINLIGGSYGTRAGLEYLRLYPNRVRRLVLDGLAPPDGALPLSMGADARTALLNQFDRCESDTTCRTHYPKLREQWAQLLEKPQITINGRHPVTGKAERFSMPSAWLWEFGRLALYSPEIASTLPHAISEAALGNWSPFLGVLSLMNTHPRKPMAAAMHFAVLCAEDMPLIEGRVPGVSAPQFTGEAFAAAKVGLERYEQACRIWPRGRVDPEFYEMKPSPAPVVLLSGGADPVTPPHHGARVAQKLGDRARHEVVLNAGHGVMGLPCMRDALFEFINADTDANAQSVRLDCARNLPAPVPFISVGAQP